MAHPKRRQSKTRTAKRRTHDKAVAPTLAICPNCGEWHVYHTVCGACFKLGFSLIRCLNVFFSILNVFSFCLPPNNPE